MALGADPADGAIQRRTARDNAFEKQMTAFVSTVTRVHDNQRLNNHRQRTQISNVIANIHPLMIARFFGDRHHVRILGFALLLPLTEIGWRHAMSEATAKVLTLDAMYAQDCRNRRETPPRTVCEGLSGKDAHRFTGEELRRLAEHLEAPKAKVGPGLEVRHAPCVRPRRPRLSAEAVRRLAGISPSILLRSELTLEGLYPWCTIGKLFVGRDGNFANPMWAGSAALVGPNLLLTASHAAPWGIESWWMRFVPAYRQGNEPFGSSYVESYRGVRNQDDVTGLDYVICKLYTRLGDTTGWMGSHGSSGDGFYMDGTWTSVGYPGDSMNGQVPMVELGIRLDDVDDEGSDGKELESHVFSTPGWSGGPLWGWVDDQPKVVGVMSGFEEEFSFWDFFTADHSVSAGGNHMVNLVKYGWANWT